MFETTETTEFDKIGVNVVQPYQLKGRWVFDKDGRTWDMAPAGLTDAVLSPMILGADRILAVACKEKGILNPENGFNLLFSTNYFPTCDVAVTFVENKFDGHVYSVASENMKVSSDQQVWLCPYFRFYYSEVPQKIYVKVEAK